jgi:hypothetical protein
VNNPEAFLKSLFPSLSPWLGRSAFFRVGWGALLLTFMVVLCACPSTPPPVTTTSSVDDGIRRESLMTPQQREQFRHPVNAPKLPDWIVITKIEVPIDADLSTTFDSTTTTQPIDPEMLEFWRVNGFKLAVLPKENVEAFSKSLPVRYASDAHMGITVSDKLCPYAVAPGITAPTPVEVVLPTFQGSGTVPVGRFQLLMRASKVTEEGGELEVIPHLYFPKESAFPKTPEEQNLDGTIFREMDFKTHIQAGDYLLIAYDGSYRPAVVEEAPVPATEPQNPIATDASTQPDTYPATEPGVFAPRMQPWASDGSTTNPSDSPRRKRRLATKKPPTPEALPRLGDMTLTFMRLNQRVQGVLVIKVVQGDPGGPQGFKVPITQAPIPTGPVKRPAKGPMVVKPKTPIVAEPEIPPPATVSSTNPDDDQ